MELAVNVKCILELFLHQRVLSPGMADYEGEQEMEMEALNAILMDEMTGKATAITTFYSSFA